MSGERMPAWSLAIDFGTTNTAAAYRVGAGRPQPVRLSEQADQMPSAVLASDTGIVVGNAAVRAARLDPSMFENCPKRRLGEGEILLGDTEFAVIDLVAAVLHQVLVRAMRMAGGGLPSEVVLTFPQEWAAGRQALLVAAAARAGFAPGSVRMVTEPIAAASWYAATQPVPAGKYVAVFDFGGGTLDVAVLRADERSNGFFQVVAADGIDPLGGEILDLRLQEWLIGQLREGGHRELLAELTAPEHLGALQTLREQIRHAKHELSEYESARIPVVVGDRQTVITVTAGEFDRLVSADIDSAVELTRRTLQRAGVTADQLHALYLTGGSSHLRLVHRRITELLGRSPATLNDPKLVVALGALTVPAGAAVAAVDPKRPTGRPVGGPGGPVASPGSATEHRSASSHQAQPTASRPEPSGPGPQGPGPGTRPADRFAAAPTAARAPKKQWGTGTIIALMALVAVIVVIAFVAFTPKRGTDDPDGATVAESVTGTTGGSVDSSGPDSSEAGTVTAGTTFNVPIYCWDDSTAAPGQTCPPLAGPVALQWVFPIEPGKVQPVCVQPETPVYDTPLLTEYLACTFEDLPNSTVYLGQWQDTASARSIVGGSIEDATSAVSRAYDNGKAEDSAAVDGTVWSGTDSAKNQKRFTFSYNTQPFTLELVINNADQADGTSTVAETELVAWDDRQKFRYANGLEAGGSGTKGN